MSAEAAPEVSIFLPTRNGGPRLREVLRAVRAQQTRRGFEIVAIDSGSTDGTPAVLRDHGARVLEISAAGFDHGLTRNQGIASSRGRLVVLLTQDAVPAGSGWLEALLAPLADPEVAGVTARQIPRPEADALTRRRIESSFVGSPQRRVQRMPDPVTWGRLHPMERYRLCCFDNVCSVVRRSVWERIPFERAYFAEDLDWGKKVLEAGGTLVYEPAAAVIHSHARPIWYDAKRAYAGHRRLYELFGLRSVPRLRDALRIAARGGAADALFALREERGVGRKLWFAARAPVAAVASSLAQWRGAADERMSRPLPALRGV